MSKTSTPIVQNSDLQKWSKWQFWGLQFDQNWFHVKYEWQINHEISTLCSLTFRVRQGLQKYLIHEIFWKIESEILCLFQRRFSGSRMIWRMAGTVIPNTNFFWWSSFELLESSMPASTKMSDLTEVLGMFRYNFTFFGLNAGVFQVFMASQALDSWWFSSKSLEKR